MKGIYRFYWDCGRRGNVSGIFIATQEQINLNIGKRVYLGEVFGKYSEIYGILEWGDISLITEDQDFILKVEEYGLTSGYNPLRYIDNEYEEVELDESTDTD